MLHSPFPGVDPYLEGRRWQGFCVHLFAQLANQLARRLEPRYETLIEEYVYLVVPPVSERTPVRPDVAVVDAASPVRAGGSGQGGGVTVLQAAPSSLALPQFQTETQRSLHIVDAEKRKVVTIVEVLSPANKESGTGQRDYLQKRGRILRTPTHLVELDLLRGGARLPMDTALPSGDYFAIVSAAPDRPDCGVWAWTVRDPLPTIPVPLLPDDPPAPLDLQAAFEAAYAWGRYAHSVDYAGPPAPPLAAADRAWAAECIRASVVWKK